MWTCMAKYTVESAALTASDRWLMWKQFYPEADLGADSFKKNTFTSIDTDLTLCRSTNIFFFLSFFRNKGVPAKKTR